MPHPATDDERREPTVVTPEVLRDWRLPERGSLAVDGGGQVPTASMPSSARDDAGDLVLAGCSVVVHLIVQDEGAPEEPVVAQQP